MRNKFNEEEVKDILFAMFEVYHIGESEKFRTNNWITEASTPEEVEMAKLKDIETFMYYCKSFSD